MHRFISLRLALIGAIYVALYSAFMLACSETEVITDTKTKTQAQEQTQNILSASEILSYAIKEKLNVTQAKGHYLFVCGPSCKGCVQNTLLALDSLFQHQVLKAEDWSFITSKTFVLSYDLQYIDFLYDATWENVNYDFSDAVYIRFLNDSLICSKKLRSQNLKDLKACVDA